MAERGQYGHTGIISEDHLGMTGLRDPASERGRGVARLTSRADRLRGDPVQQQPGRAGLAAGWRVYASRGEARAAGPSGLRAARGRGKPSRDRPLRNPRCNWRLASPRRPRLPLTPLCRPRAAPVPRCGPEPPPRARQPTQARPGRAPASPWASLPPRAATGPRCCDLRPAPSPPPARPAPAWLCLPVYCVPCPSGGKAMTERGGGSMRGMYKAL